MEALRKTYLALGEHVSAFAELERRSNGLEYEIARLTEENRLLVEYIEAEREYGECGLDRVEDPERDCRLEHYRASKAGESAEPILARHRGEASR